mgnify:FL=1
MVEVSQQNTQRQDLLSQLLGRKPAASSKASQTPKTPVYVPKGREIHDTVELSDGAKIINLNRGLDLSKEYRNDKDASTLQERLRQGSSDIERIGRLFREVFAGMRSLFGR